ncbi:MAG TPA: nuclear transport factor 2 family protein [Blastocatellia bacterium]
MKRKFLSGFPNSPRRRKHAETMNGKKTFLFILQAFSLCLCVSVANAIAQEGRAKQAGKENPKSAAAEIRATLDAQVAAWNAGKLEEFMDGYWRSPDLTFFSAGRKLSGWDATIERYRKTYQAEGKEMGQLAFSDLDIQLLGPAAAVVRGRWELTMSDGKKPGGLYTLIFRRFKEGWKIVHDHTSSSQ